MRWYSVLRPALFLLPPETAHRAAIMALRAGLGPVSRFTHPGLQTHVGAITLPNPVGLAAGFDKNAECYAECLRAGFGFVEVGTVTPRAQAGNPCPRMFRLTDRQAVINRLGFNNGGAQAAARRLNGRFPPSIHPAPLYAPPASGGSKRGEVRGGGIVGGNIGKNKETEDALADYVAAMRVMYPHVDYITANISSPNTPGLRDLQQGEALRALLRGLHAARAELVAAGAAHKPIWLKIAPDNDAATLAAIATVAREEGLDAIIVSNTTMDRAGIAGSRYAAEAGGLSGKPLLQKSTEMLRAMYRLTEGSIPLIGVGGIASAEDAYAKIRAGASAVQLYTALVYQGFGLVERINRGLVELLARDGFATLADAVGVDA